VPSQWVTLTICDVDPATGPSRQAVNDPAVNGPKHGITSLHSCTHLMQQKMSHIHTQQQEKQSSQIHQHHQEAAFKQKPEARSYCSYSMPKLNTNRALWVAA